MDISSLTIAQIRAFLKRSTQKKKKKILALLRKDKRAGVAKLVFFYENVLAQKEQDREMFLCLSNFERRLRKQGFKLVAGADEVGRGALAGPLVAAAVILPQDFYAYGLKESKQLSPTRREELHEIIVSSAVAWSVAVVEPAEIDSQGLQKANLKVLRQAVESLNPSPEYVLCDGFSIRGSKKPNLALVKGDRLSVSIAAASIVAKVTRDRMMESYHQVFPRYSFDQNKGYGTIVHLRSLEKHGPSPIHRRSFAHVAQLSFKIE